MGKTKQSKTRGKGRQDKYYRLAKEQGYRARSAFKLIQLNRKYNFLDSCKCLIDLCAAPGGWMQVAQKYMPVESLIIGVDLVSMRPIKDCIGLQGDIRTDKCRADVRKHLHKWKADVVLHDGSPNMGTAWAQDAYDQSELTLHAMRFATDFLKEGGWFVSKVFRSADYNSLLWVAKQLFKSVEATKPPASRGTSAEIYMVCRGFLDPKVIDPKLLDPRHVFAELAIEEKEVNIFGNEKKKKRHRTGYTVDGVSLFVGVPVTEFVLSDNPIKILADANQLQFDEASMPFRSHPATTKEVKSCCDDLRVLGKAEFRCLLKWRLSLRDTLDKAVDRAKEDGSEDEDDEEEQDDEDDDEDGDDTAEGADGETTTAMAEEDAALAKQLAAARAKQKRKERRTRRQKMKYQHRVDIGMEVDGSDIQQDNDLELFNLRGAKKRGLNDVVARAVRDEESSSDDDDESEDERDYDEILEDNLDQMYDRYMKFSKQKSKTQEKRLKAQGKDDDDFNEDVEEGQEEVDEEEENPLVVNLGGKEARISKGASMWYGGDMFQDMVGLMARDGEKAKVKRRKVKGDDDDDEPMTTYASSSDEDEYDGDSESDLDNDDNNDVDDVVSRHDAGGTKSGDTKRSGSRQLIRKATAPVGGDDDDTKGRKRKRQDHVRDHTEEAEGALSERKQRRKDFHANMVKKEEVQRLKDLKKKPKGYQSRIVDEGSGFEVVPAEDSDDYDSDDKATALALGVMVANKEKSMEDLINQGYNKWAFDDGEEMPAWFCDDEDRHYKPQSMVTRQQREDAVARFTALDARPIKKVAEARARKKMKAHKRMEKVKSKANAIASQGDLTERDKAKQIQRLYNADKKAEKPGTVYVPRKKFQKGAATKQAIQSARASNRGSRIKLVDKRMKTDKRGEKRAKSRSKKKGGR